MTEKAATYQAKPKHEGRFDPQSDTWLYIKDCLEKAIKAARSRNDQHMSYIETVKLRERIATLRYVLNDLGREKRPEDIPPENSWNLEGY